MQGRNDFQPVLWTPAGSRSSGAGYIMSLLLDPIARGVLPELPAHSASSHLATATQLNRQLFSMITLPLARGQLPVEEAAQSAHDPAEERLTPKPLPTAAPEQVSFWRRFLAQLEQRVLVSHTLFPLTCRSWSQCCMLTPILGLSLSV